jgi:transcriptional regulator with XRE-family HTH domain
MGKFAKCLEGQLKEKNITKAELARRIGLKRQNYINNIVAGLHTPTIKRVEQISARLQSP